MAKEHTNDGKQQDSGHTKPVIPAVSNNNNSSKEKDTKTGDKSKQCDNKCEIPQPLSVKAEEKEGLKTSEKVSIASALISLASVIVAAIALGNTVRSVRATEKMVELAKARDSTTIKQTQDLNRPYLEISYDSFKLKQVGQPLSIVFSIRNIGQYAAMMKEGRFWLMIDSTTPTNPFNPEPTLKAKISAINTYAVKEFKDPQEFKSDFILTAGMANGVILKKTYISFFGEIKYINELTKEPAKYRFNIKFADADLRNYTLVLNENIH
jgi:hypothetical protein